MEGRDQHDKEGQTETASAREVNAALVKAKALFYANEDSEIDFELTEALAHVNTAFDYLEERTKGQTQE